MGKAKTKKVKRFEESEAEAENVVNKMIADGKFGLGLNKLPEVPGIEFSDGEDETDIVSITQE